MSTTKMREHFTKVDCIYFQFVFCFSPLLEIIFSDLHGDNEGTKYAQTLLSHQLHWHEHIDGDLETLKSLRFPLSHSHKKEEGHKTRWQEPPLEPKQRKKNFPFQKKSYSQNLDTQNYRVFQEGFSLKYSFLHFEHENQLRSLLMKEITMSYTYLNWETSTGTKPMTSPICYTSAPPTSSISSRLFKHLVTRY